MEHQIIRYAKMTVTTRALRPNGYAVNETLFIRLSSNDNSNNKIRMQTLESRLYENFCNFSNSFVGIGPQFTFVFGIFQYLEGNQAADMCCFSFFISFLLLSNIHLFVAMSDEHRTRDKDIRIKERGILQ